MKPFRQIGKILIFILLPAYIWLLSNTVVNQHAHMGPHGEIIVHSHPYHPDQNSRSTFQSHQHSAFQLFLIEQFSTISLIPVLFLVISAVLAIAIGSKETFSSNPLLQLALIYPNHYRAPPFRGSYL